MPRATLDLSSGRKLALGAALFAGLSVLMAGTVSARAEAAPAIDIAVDRPVEHRELEEEVIFEITVRQNGEALPEAPCTVTLRRDFGTVLSSEQVRTPAAVAATLDTPGFLICEVRYQPADGKAVAGSRVVPFASERIQPAMSEPEDFDAFWQAGRQEVRGIPADAVVTPLPQWSGKSFDAFKISLANLGGTRAWAFLSVPKGRPGPFPLLNTVPGANLNAPTRPESRLTERGVMRLLISVHAHDPNLAKEEMDELMAAGLGGYTRLGAPDRDRYYFRRAILGADRLIDYVCENYEWDGRHCVVMGGSQGGAFALFMAGINPQVTACAADKPALCDHGGYTVGRGTGWPNLASYQSPELQEATLAMSAYFDAAHFAGRIQVPTVVGVGFLDGTCPPSSVYAAFNRLRGPKRIIDEPDRGHQFGKGPFAAFAEGSWLYGVLGLAEAVAPCQNPTSSQKVQ